MAVPDILRFIFNACLLIKLGVLFIKSSRFLMINIKNFWFDFLPFLISNKSDQGIKPTDKLFVFSIMPISFMISPGVLSKS